MTDTTAYTFKLSRYNPRRRARMAPAAEVECYENGELVDRLWMDLQDVKANIAEYGKEPGLIAALAAYSLNEEVGG